MRILEIGGGGDSSLLHLLEWLPNSDIHESDGAYRVYEWLPHDRHMIGKCGAVNRNKALRSNLRGNLNRLPMRTNGYGKSADMLKYPLAIAL